MMNEENRKGPGIFYAVVGVATLVVAIIGATFAYFSASATNETPITGETLNVTSGFKVTATRLTYEGADKASSINLVPADFGADFTPATISGTNIANALNNHCQNAGYTGCHVWKIEATTEQDLASASLALDLSVTPASGANTDNWSYAVFTSESALADLAATDISATNLAVVTGGAGLINTGVDFDMHAAAVTEENDPMAAGTHTYYLMVYLNNIDASQSGGDNVAGSTGTATNNLGTYNGTVTFNAAGGKIVASFAAQG